MTKFIYVLFAFLVACTDGTLKQSALPAGSKVLILGDSLSYGTGAKPGEDYPTLLARTTGWEIVNAGVPGDTTAGGLGRLPALLAQHQPALLIVELGGNDFLHQLPSQQTEGNLKAIVTQAAGTKVLLLAIPEFSPVMAAVGNLSDHPMYERVADETNTPLIAEVFSDVLSDRALKADQVHPNVNGYAQVATKIEASLRELGYLR